ncbi:dynein regulatory complex protein 8-like isoform X2 [Bombus huntii]|uniref:dynein regulatory complex protein 8-like isoform X2 n=1 Tax=Bombus huntii TaxID=85661 RepID=UPI0021AAF26F|nr:dynein regulatory complex protein 8-like isoform X2 [Bombus huntii]
MLYIFHIFSYLTHTFYTVPVSEPTLLEKRLCEIFDIFDTAKTGEIDVRDLGTIIRALGCIITEAELQEIQVEVEDVVNNCVPLNKFLEYMSKAINERKFKPAEPEDLLKAFQLLDPENRGYIMREDLEKAMMEIGEPFSKEEISNMMAIACDPQTRKINYEHYINLLLIYGDFQETRTWVGTRGALICTACRNKGNIQMKIFRFTEMSNFYLYDH